jgi:hypothetical protein
VVALSTPRQEIRRSQSLDLAQEEGPRKFHVVITANDAVYQEWQSLIMFWWYQKVKRDNPDCDMGGFTRVLHAWKPDGLMEQIPTMLVNPLPRGQDQGYVVLNRPFALMQFMEQAHIKEDYILMAEPDHLMLKPIPNLATPDKPAAFPFFYINTKVCTRGLYTPPHIFLFIRTHVRHATQGTRHPRLL